MSTLRRRKIPSRWWFSRMRQAAAGTLSAPTPKTTLGVPYSQIELAAKLTANPDDDVQHRTEVLRGEWD